MSIHIAIFSTAEFWYLVFNGVTIVTPLKTRYQNSAVLKNY